MSASPAFLRRFLLVLLALSILALCAARAHAGCPERTVAEEGGTHWCFDAGARGHVHLWKPGRYDAATAVTVVYLHGHNLGLEGCADAHYLDCAWEKQGLAAQFAASGLDALFIAVEGPVGNAGKPKWTSLDDLRAMVRKRGGIRPPATTAVLAHSAGIFTAMKLMEHGGVTHLVALDALYQDAPKRITRWFNGSKSRRLTLVGADSIGWRVPSLAKTLGCAVDKGVTGSYPHADRCAAALDGAYGHMDVVTGGKVIPAVLGRMSSPTAKNPRRKKRLRKRKTAR